MSARCRPFFAVLLVVAVAAQAAGQPPPAMSDQYAARLLVPAYIFPNLDPKQPGGLKKWDTLIKSAAPDCPIVAILNPASGPVDPTDKAGEPLRIKCYQALLADANKRSQALRFVMYVPLAQRKKTANGQDWLVRANATADIDTWLKTYPPADFPNLIGFFLDEHPASDPDQLAAAKTVREYAANQLPGALVFLNVGRLTDTKILDMRNTSEVAILWENSAKVDLKAKLTLPAWADEKAENAFFFQRRRFAALVYEKPKLQADFVALVNARPPAGKRIGWLYVTDRNANWDDLPSYWPDLVAAVKKQNIDPKK